MTSSVCKVIHVHAFYIGSYIVLITAVSEHLPVVNSHVTNICRVRLQYQDLYYLQNDMNSPSLPLSPITETTNSSDMFPQRITSLQKHEWQKCTALF